MNIGIKTKKLRAIKIWPFILTFAFYVSSFGQTGGEVEDLFAEFEEPATDTKVATPAKEEVPVSLDPEPAKNSELEEALKLAEEPSNPPSVAEPQKLEPTPTNAPMLPELDKDKERKFHEVYAKYNRTPTSQDNWEKVYANKKPQIYQVNKGDTLWEVSKTLFGDPYFWPKIWALNSDRVFNPHEIAPGLEVYFFAGTRASLPAVSVGLAKSRLLSGGSIPPPLKQYSPVLKSLPQSLPRYKYSRVNKEKSSITIEEVNRTTKSPNMYLSYMISEQELPIIGEVLETELGGATSADFQYIFVRLNKDDLEGPCHTVTFLDPVKNEKGDDLKLVEVEGELDIRDIVNPEEKIYRAKITKSLTNVKVGSKLIQGSLPRFDSGPTPVTTSPGIRVIGGEYAADRGIFFQNSLVFLDKGESAGLSSGQSLNIFANAKLRNENTKINFDRKKIGEVKVVHLTPGYAVGFITKAFDEVRLGDLVGEE